MWIVTGATGKLGHTIVERLLETEAAKRIGISVRNPDKAADLAERGVSVRRGDFTDPDSLQAAFAGASQVLIVSSSTASHGDDPLAQHRAAIDAARAAGTTRLVYVSAMGASPDGIFPTLPLHAATEALLRATGLRWTALRNGFYAENAPMMIGDAVASGVLSAPADGKVAWTARDDLAAAAAAIFRDEARADGPTPPLTGPDALDLGDIATILGDIHGRRIERRVIVDDELMHALTDRGSPPRVVQTVLGMYQAARAGEFAPVDPTLATILGRPLKTLSEVLAEAAKRPS